MALLAELTSEGASAGTVRDLLRLILELARRSDAIKVNPVEGVKAPKKPLAQMVFMNADQIMTVAEEVTHPPIKRGGGNTGAAHTRSADSTCVLPASLDFARAGWLPSEPRQSTSSTVAFTFSSRPQRHTESSSSDTEELPTPGCAPSPKPGYRIDDAPC